ncbi:hypothetical protein CVT25_004701 [Psilocybe cyanescens]|uniref:Uncharacterized protein n=1 Tax=Psilocybe cyanescens TaxID=93625 RepID=A0A409XIU7_PSICY|nr:hypothetical protein CVT25_004701 [Psilocybe cyanescens]
MRPDLDSPTRRTTSDRSSARSLDLRPHVDPIPILVPVSMPRTLHSDFWGTSFLSAFGLGTMNDGECPCPCTGRGAGVGAGTTTSNDSSSARANEMEAGADDPSEEERPVVGDVAGSEVHGGLAASGWILSDRAREEEGAGGLESSGMELPDFVVFVFGSGGKRKAEPNDAPRWRSTRSRDLNYSDRPVDRSENRRVRRTKKMSANLLSKYKQNETGRRVERRSLIMELEAPPDLLERGEALESDPRGLVDVFPPLLHHLDPERRCLTLQLHTPLNVHAEVRRHAPTTSETPENSSDMRILPLPLPHDCEFEPNVSDDGAHECRSPLTTSIFASGYTFSCTSYALTPTLDRAGRSGCSTTSSSATGAGVIVLLWPGRKMTIPDEGVRGKQQ